MSDLSGESFKATEVTAHYVHRPPYAAQVHQTILAETAATDRLLDLGCGEGKIARPMAKAFDQVVAVDPSDNMITLGQSLDNGDAANIEWITAKAENAPLEGLFDMVTFASSIHWMNPQTLFEMLRLHLKPTSFLAIVTGDTAFDPPWEADWQQFLKKWVPIASGRPLGSKEWQDSRDKHLAEIDVIRSDDFVSEPFVQTVEGYILCQHARNTFALPNLGARVTEFQDELRRLLMPYADETGLLRYRVKTNLTLAQLKPKSH